MGNTREIKFRVWRFCHHLGQHKFYYLNNLRIVCDGGANLLFTERDDDFCDGMIIEPEDGVVIQQCTGLTDKAGKEIYEGDIISYEVERYSERGEFEDYTETGKITIAFRDGVFGHSDYHTHMRPIRNQAQIRYCNKYEVVGNILENS